MITSEQLAFFARNGYLQLRQFIQPDTCKQLIDLTWERLPTSWRRDDPDTWAGVVADTCHTGDVHERRGHLRFQRGNILASPHIAETFGREGPVGSAVEAIIGHPIAPMRTRGFYVIVPFVDRNDISPVTRPHIEAHAVQVICLCYLDDVAPGGGGLSIWPGSHRDVYPTMASKLEHIAGPSHGEVMASWRRKMPIELHGLQGDVVLIHHRLLHAASVNSANKLRLGFLCDYLRNDADALCEQSPAALWEDWPAISALPEVERDSPCDISLLPIPSDIAALPQHHADGTRASTARSAAARLVRLRQPGDYWLSISDNPKVVGHPILDPLGGSLDDLGASVYHNGKPVASQSDFDFVARLDMSKGANRIYITDVNRPLWYRLLKIQMPFRNNEIVSAGILRSGVNTLTHDDRAQPRVRS